MDEFHNLVKPSPEIRKSPTRMLMLTMLREMLRTAKNSVIVGFTATPLVGEDGSAEELLNIIKGKGNEKLSDEGSQHSTPNAHLYTQPTYHECTLQLCR